ncbi:MAG: 4Fe-4S dicluster domain-containing protein, partial [Robiginitalea sp.]
MDENSKDTRRKFLNNGWKLGLASIVGGAALTHLKEGFAFETKGASGEKMELMDVDGNIIEVDPMDMEEVDLE